MGNKKRAWNRSRNYRSRKVDNRNLRKRFLIVCEGTKTEPNYFKCFRVNKKIVDVKIEGLGYNTVSLVKEAISLKAREDYDQVWCVFDRDSFSPRDFNAAFRIAQSNNIEIAYSNQAFELWYLLHFHYYDEAIQRTEYCKMLTKLLGHKYEKNSETIYEELLSLQPDAIRNAQRLHSSYSPCKPEQDNPSPTVYLLVNVLNQYSA